MILFLFQRDGIFRRRCIAIGPDGEGAFSWDCIMEWEDVFPWFTLAILGALGLAVKSSREARALRGGFETLTDRVGRLDALVQRLQTAPPAPTVEANPAFPPRQRSRSPLPQLRR